MLRKGRKPLQPNSVINFSSTNIFWFLQAISLFFALLPLENGHAQSSSVEQVLREQAPSFMVAGKAEDAEKYVAGEGWAELTWRLGSDQEAEGLQETIDALPEAEKPVFELQQAPNSDFSDPMTIYEGRDLASVVSGLREDTYYFRVRGKTPDGGVVSPWSKAEVIEVSYPAYQRWPNTENFQGPKVLWWQLGAGLLVFLCTIGFLIFMAMRGLREGTGQAPRHG